MEKYNVPLVKNAHDIEVEVPGSKSITNRALLIAALASGKSKLTGVLFSDDSRHFLGALVDLGFNIEINEEEKVVVIEGLGGDIPKKKASVDVGSAGTAARFLTAYLGLAKGSYLMNSSEQMKKRPMEELLTALADLGSSIEYKENQYHFPYEITGNGFAKNEVTIDVDKSSQFLSALLIVSVLSNEDFLIHVVGSHGMAYVDMTIKMMEQFGVSVVRQSDKDFLIKADAKYQARDYIIEPDLSAACYFYAMSPLLNVKSTVKRVTRDCLQGDIKFLEVLEKMGCMVEEKDGRVTVCPSANGLAGGEFDLSSFSDQALTLAAIAPFAKEDVLIKNVGHIRLQECDRIAAILTNLKACGIDAIEKDGDITIHPGKTKAAEILTYDDHRVAMSFSLIGLLTEGIVIQDPMCCRKTFENYFDVLEKSVIK